MERTDPQRTILLRTLGLLLITQCAGLLLSVLKGSSPIETVLFMHLQTGETISLWVDRLGAMACVTIAAVALTGRWQGGLLFVSGWFTLIAMARAYDGGTHFSGFSLPAHATRIALPLAAFAVRRVGPHGWRRPEALRWGLRIAIALTFAAHGHEALAGHPHFVDYILTADRKLFGLGIDQAAALNALAVIGALDIAVAAAVLAAPDLSAVLLYAALWGALTAFARIVHMDSRYPDTLIRAANAGLPLVLWLCRGRLPSFPPAARGLLPWQRLRPALAALCVATLAATGGYASLRASGADAADVSPRQLRLIWREQPSTETVVAWSTGLEGREHTVYFDTQPREGALEAYRFQASTARDGQYSGGSSFYHHAILEGLSPSTTYYFVVVSDGEASEEYHFTTAHADDREFRLLYGGDSRSSRTNRRRVNQLIRGLVEQDPRILAFAHGGDYVEDGRDFDQWDGWLDDLQDTVTSDRRVLPIIPARGNHEASGSLYGQVFANPGRNSGNYYTTRLSPQVAFIVLNTNGSLAGDQRSFLEDQLRRRSADTRWLFASYHRPAYPAVKSAGAALEHWVPLFEEFDVDLVCESDGHVLKRTVPMRAGSRAEDGIVYIGEGGLGVSQRTPRRASYLAMAESTHHVQVLTIRPDKLKYEAVALQGASVADRYERLPVREGTPSVGRLLAARVLASQDVLLTYSKPVDLDTALQADRYALAPAGDVRSVGPGPDDSSVVLTTSALAGGTYTVEVRDVIDVDGNEVNSQVDFVLAGGAAPGDDTPGACEADADGDGLNDCEDRCPADARKGQPGQCGCGTPDADRDGDGTADCVDTDPADGGDTPGAGPDLDTDADPLEGRPDTPEGSPPSTGLFGFGCSASGPLAPAQGPWAALTLLGLLGCAACRRAGRRS